MANTVNINQNNNDVSLQDNNRRIIITDNNAGTTINVTQPVTSIVTVSALGPQGAQGPAGETPDTGSFVLTSSFNAFTASYYIDSASFETRILSNSSSIALLSGSFKTVSGSFSTRITNLENFSSSLNTIFATDAELNAATASLSASIANLSSSFGIFSGSYNTGSFTGSFYGDGSNLTGIVSSKWTGSNPITRNGNVEITGSLIVSGANGGINTANNKPFLFDNSGISRVNWGQGYLKDTNDIQSIDWESRLALDNNEATSIDWQTRLLTDSNFNTVLDWENKYLYGTSSVSDQILTRRTNSNSQFYPTIVDSSNTPADYETVYTAQGITFNPATSGITAASFTGSLFGTASFSQTASYASASDTLTVVKTGSNSAFFPLIVDRADASPTNLKAYTTSNISFNPNTGGITATSFTGFSFTGSLLGTASNSSFATTASFANITTSSSLAQTASLALRVSGSLTGSLLGTASFASTASFVQTAQTASYVLQAVSASFASTASFVRTAQTASYVLQAVSASFASTASFVQNAISASYVLSSSYAVSASFASTAISSSYVLTASYSNTSISASYAISASYVLSSSYATTSSYAIYAETASHAINGGVTQIIAGSNITVSPTTGKGQVTISSIGGGGSSFNTATGSYGSFHDTTIQTNPVANIARSMSFNTTDISNGVSISGSISPFDTYIKTENPGVYNIQFSAQVDKTDGGTDDVVIWLRKNGIDLTDTATTLTLPTNNSKVVAAWNWFVNSAANDYYQIIWYSADTDLRLLAETASGGHPGIPSVILTVNRVDQFLSNTGSFSGSFTGTFTGSLFGTASWASNSITSSFITASNVIGTVTSASYALTASFALNGGGGSGDTTAIEAQLWFLL